MKADRDRQPALVRTFAVPALIALVSSVGLVAALLGDGAFDMISWLGLAIPVGAIAWAMLKKRR